jgi:hypothetical protein
MPTWRTGAESYRRYFDRNSREGLTQLDSAQGGGYGSLRDIEFWKWVEEAKIISDIKTIPFEQFNKPNA